MLGMHVVHRQQARTDEQVEIDGEPDRLTLQIRCAPRRFSFLEQCGHHGKLQYSLSSRVSALLPVRGRARMSGQRRAARRTTAGRATGEGPRAGHPDTPPCQGRRMTTVGFRCRIRRSSRTCPATGPVRRSTTKRHNPFRQNGPAVNVDTVIRHLPLTPFRWSIDARIAPSIIRNPPIRVRQSVAQAFRCAQLGRHLTGGRFVQSQTVAALFGHGGERVRPGRSTGHAPGPQRKDATASHISSWQIFSKLNIAPLASHDRPRKVLNIQAFRTDYNDIARNQSKQPILFGKDLAIPREPG